MLWFKTRSVKDKIDLAEELGINMIFPGAVA